ncbi:MAG TPA: ATP-binding protein, partial [Cyclobacteriaceae bacterium]|nr:ATP-binding protein [Cyclobacteriaceae bacterium]
TDIAECIDASLILLKSKLEGESVTVIRSYTSCRVRAHSGRLSQVFINLIDNAIYAMKERQRDNRKLEVLLTLTDDTARIDFTDNGSGIPEEIKNNIFNAFFTTKDTGQGTGLGLFICHSIVEEFGGNLTFTSTRNAGTTFTATLNRSKF